MELDAKTKAWWRNRIRRNGYFRAFSIEESEVEREVMLWRKVLDRAVLDVIADNSPHFEETKEWALVSCQDFSDVCENARLPSEKVRSFFKFII